MRDNCGVFPILLGRLAYRSVQTLTEVIAMNCMMIFFIMGLEENNW